MNFGEKQKNKIGEQLTRRVAQALKEGELTMEELPTVCSYILDNINKITNHSQLIEFLTTLSQKWPIFSHILTLEKGEEYEEKDEKKAEEMTKLIKENKIEEAIKTAGSLSEEKKKEEK